MSNDVIDVDGIEIVDSVEIVDSKRSDIDEVAGSIGNFDDINDFENLDDIEVIEPELTSDKLEEGYARNNAAMDRVSNENSLALQNRNFDFSTLSSKIEKFNTLIYLNKKKSRALTGEIQILRAEVVESYKNMLTSSPGKNSSVSNKIRDNLIAPGSNALDIIIKNTCYQYRINNFSVEDICDSLCWRMAFNMSGADNRELSFVSRDAFINQFECYKFHLNILVPIIIDKITNSWYLSELDEINDIYGLLVSKMFLNNSVSDVEQFYRDDAMQAFSNNKGQEILDEEYEDIIASAFNDLSKEFDNVYYSSSYEMFYDFLEFTCTSIEEYGHYSQEYLSLFDLIKSNKSVEFWKDKELGERFNIILVEKIKDYSVKVEKRQKGPNRIVGITVEGIINRPYGKSITRYSSSSGAKGISDLVIPELFKNWQAVYNKPFNDKTALNFFLSQYMELSGSKISGTDLGDEFFKKWFMYDITDNEFNVVFNYLVNVMYSNKSTIILGEYINFISKMKSKLGISSLLENEKVYELQSTQIDKLGDIANMYKAIDYLEDKIEFIDKVILDSASGKYITKCNCSNVIDVDSDGNISGFDVDVDNLLTTIRINANRSGDKINFDLSSAIESCLSSLNSNGTYNSIGNNYELESSIFFVDQKFVKCTCGKIHMFRTGMYMALDLCSHKFMSERKNTKSSKFIQRCHLSSEFLMESANDIYNYFEANGRNYDESPVKLPDIIEESYIEKEDNNEDYSEFDRLADEFIGLLKADIDKYEYQDMLEVQSRISSVAGISDIDELSQWSEEVDEQTNRVNNLNKKYYNNFIWYFLKSYCRVDMDAVKLVKYKLCEIYGKDTIIKIMECYDSLKVTLSEMGKYEYCNIRNLDNSGIFTILDIGFDSMDSKSELPSLNDSKSNKLIYKYINLGRKAALNSSTEEEFLENLSKIKISKDGVHGCSITDGASALVEAFRDNKNFSFDNEDLVKKLEIILTNKVNSLKELDERFEQLVDSIVNLVNSASIDKETGFFNCDFCDFNLDEFLIILGCVKGFGGIRREQGSEVNNYMKEVEKYKEVIESNILTRFVDLNEDAELYLNYILGYMNYNFDFNKLKNSDMFDYVIGNLCLPKRRLHSQEKKIEGFDDLKELCLNSIEYSATCEFYDEVLEMCFNSGLNIALSSIEDDFIGFAFRLLRVIPVNFYSSSLLNSTIGKGITEFKKKVEEGFENSEVCADTLKNSFQHQKLYPRITYCSKLFSEIRAKFEESGLHFIITDKDGKVLGSGIRLGEKEMVSKVESIIYELFMLMDMEFSGGKAAYPNDIFEAFNLVYNLPDCLLAHSLREEFDNYSFKFKKDYDFIEKNLNMLCDSQLAIDCCKGVKINYHLENDQLFELYNLGRLVVNGSFVARNATDSIVNSTLA